MQKKPKPIFTTLTGPEISRMLKAARKYRLERKASLQIQLQQALNNLKKK